MSNILPEGKITSGQAAEILGLEGDLNYLYYLRNIGRLHPVKLGTTLLWDEAEVRKYKSNHPRIGQRRKK
jgi:hypothetical protein